jgi:hypothetical protein
VARRSARFALIGAAVVATAAFVYERTLPFTSYVYRRKNGPWIHEPPRAHVLGFELSPTEAVIWFVLLGAFAGGLLGLALARVLRMMTRPRSIVLGAVCGIAVGLTVSLDRPTYCIGGGGDGFDAVFACPYKWLFGWDAVPILADAVWAAIGLLVGSLVGYVAARVSQRRRSVLPSAT